MKVIFLVYRLNYYRFFTPLIKEGLRRGYKLECWHDYSQPMTGKKGYSFPDIKNIPSFAGVNQPKVKIFHGNDELVSLLLGDKEIDFVFSIHKPCYRLEKETVERFPFRWAVVMTGADSFFELQQVLQKNPKPNPKEIFFMYSENWLEKGRVYLKKFYPDFSNFLDRGMKCIIVGNIEFDAFKEINPNKVRDKYKIPKDKSILLYLPFPYDNRAKNSAWERTFCGMFTNTAKTKNGLYLHNKKMNPVKNFISKAYSLYRISQDRYAWEYWKKGLNEKRVFKAVRDFCDKNNLYLVVKPRLKFPVAEIVKEKADLVAWDDETQQTPPILKELLSVAGLTVSFFSLSVLSSVAADVFHLNVRLPEVFFKNGGQRFWISDEAGSYFNFAGVCASWRIEDIIDKLGNTPLDTFTIKPDERSKYMEKYFAFDDYNASERVFDALL